MSYFTKFRLRRALVVGVVAVLASAALVSVVQAARSTSAQRPSAAAGQYPDKVTICHRTGSQKNPAVTIRVSRNALPAHLRHGDTIGPCAGQSFTICHKNHKLKAPQRGKAKGRTMKVRFRSLRAHTRHGDRLRGCKTNGPARRAAASSPSRPRSPRSASAQGKDRSRAPLAAGLSLSSRSATYPSTNAAGERVRPDSGVPGQFPPHVPPLGCERVPDVSRSLEFLPGPPNERARRATAHESRCRRSGRVRPACPRARPAASGRPPVALRPRLRRGSASLRSWSPARRGSRRR